MITDHMAQKLSLSDNQKSQIYQINLERAQAMGKFKGDKEKADRSQMKAQFEASENRILAVLNDNQKATYAQLKAERQTKFKEHKGSHKRDSKK
jgi:DNA gyrase/topoisomerase IV subunit A